MSQLQFLNVDLELRGNFDLAPLVKALEEAGLLLMSEETVWDGLADFELARQPIGPTDAITELLDVLGGLAMGPKEDLERCDSIVFDVGFASGVSVERGDPTRATL